ncbi:hypothetical protein [Methylotuvimicrobium sp. KM2]
MTTIQGTPNIAHGFDEVCRAKRYVSDLCYQPIASDGFPVNLYYQAD